MENVNCLRCNFRHEDNGNCTAVGGFCTAVPASSCPLLRQYLGTELTPDDISKMKKDESRFAVGRWIYKRRHRGGIRIYEGKDEMGETHRISVDGRYTINDSYCSECGKLNESIWFNYCPNCGAKMVGGELND